ncbi:MAG: RHS repeat-associated core domain-containing protein [Chloroflexi bacterium]|nr:RHS repeat-associated core domain-containing protein [Chloroflexota bacterium]
MSYTLDAVGNRTQRVDQAGTHTYAYDDLYRLTSVTYPGPATTTYAFDAFGNRTSMTKPGSQVTTYAYNDGDRLTTVTPPSPASAVSYTWDNNGDLTARGSDSFSWDYEDRMVSATVNSVTTTFAYRGDGLRNSRTTGGNTTTFTWDINAGLPVVLDDGNQYLYGAGLEAQKQSGSWYYYLEDGLGSTMAIVDASGAVQDSYTYDIYGKPTKTGSLANEFDFAGQQTDGTGLQYLRARYMDPETGTFISREPMAAAPRWMGNPFGYGSGNPSNLSDPTGLFGCGWFKKICGGIAGASGWVAGEVAKMGKATYDWVKSVGWNMARATANAALTTFALGLLPLDKLGSCKVRADGIIGCFGVFKGFLDSIGSRAITIGNVILTNEYSWADLGDDTIRHEVNHADQWAVFGLATWPNPLLGQSAMAGSYAAFQEFKGTCANPFEKDAGIGPGTGVREDTCPVG